MRIRGGDFKPDSYVTGGSIYLFQAFVACRDRRGSIGSSLFGQVVKHPK